MKEFQAAYLPIGVPTFHLESAQAEFEASVHTLKEITEQVVCPDEMLLSLEKLDAFLDRLHPDLLILQNDSTTHNNPPVSTAWSHAPGVRITTPAQGGLLCGYCAGAPFVGSLQQTQASSSKGSSTPFAPTNNKPPLLQREVARRSRVGGIVYIDCRFADYLK